MTLNELANLFHAQELAQQQAHLEYQQTGSWHVEMCNCPRCQSLERWYYGINWGQRVLARLSYCSGLGGDRHADTQP